MTIHIIEMYSNTFNILYAFSFLNTLYTNRTFNNASIERKDQLNILIKSLLSNTECMVKNNPTISGIKGLILLSFNTITLISVLLRWLTARPVNSLACFIKTPRTFSR